MVGPISGFRTSEKQVKALASIEKEAGGSKDAAGVYLSYIKDKDYVKIKKDLVKKYVTAVRKSPLQEYHLTYDSFGESVEPIYFWLLDFMQDQPPGGLGMTVAKSAEAYEASASSGYFGEIGQRVGIMQQKAMEYMGAINQVIKSVLNLVYDLKEFEMRIIQYDKFHTDKKHEKLAAELALKAIWMDQVDTRKGLGSINQLAQRLNFATIRDLFFKIRSVNEVDTLGPINDRIKRILKARQAEFEEWLIFSEKEIRNRFAIEKAYLQSQVGTLKLYTSWVKPYLKAANKLRMKEFNMPELVNLFSSVQMELALYGKQEFKAARVHEQFEKLSLKKYYSIVEVSLLFRTMPQQVQTQQGRQYTYGGRTDMVFKAYSLDEDGMKAFESYELYEDMDLIEEWVDVSLTALYDEIQTFLYGKEEQKDVPAELHQKKENWLQALKKPFTSVGKGFKEAVSPFKDIFPMAQDASVYAVGLVKKGATDNAKMLVDTLYTVYKKTHGMLAIE